MEETAIAIEVGKLLLTMYFQQAAKANLTTEQQEELYQKTRAEFLANDPEKIPDV